MVVWQNRKVTNQHPRKHTILIPFIFQYYIKFLSNSSKQLQLASNYLSQNRWVRLNLMFYILFGNFLKILQTFAMHLGRHIDIQIFIWYSKFQTDIQSFLQGTFIFITIQHSFLKFGNIGNITSYLSTLQMIPSHQNVVLFLVDSY